MFQFSPGSISLRSLLERRLECRAGLTDDRPRPLYRRPRCLAAHLARCHPALAACPGRQQWIVLAFGALVGWIVHRSHAEYSEFMQGCLQDHLSRAHTDPNFAARQCAPEPDPAPLFRDRRAPRHSAGARASDEALAIDGGDSVGLADSPADGPTWMSSNVRGLARQVR
jgi:hypothetical protein